jgi:hypothetical protein
MVEKVKYFFFITITKINPLLVGRHQANWWNKRRLHFKKLSFKQKNLNEDNGSGSGSSGDDPFSSLDSPSPLKK